MASIKLRGDTSGEITIQAPAVAGTTTLNLPATSSTLATQNALGVRNLIINGDMRIAQRGTSIAILSNTVTYSIDRFTSYVSSTALISVQQDTDVPNGTGFKYSHKTSVTTADATLDASDNYQPCYQSIEGYNIAHLNFGTSNAQTVTLSFLVKSNKTGTYPVSFRNGSLNLSYITNFTIDSANTWENKTVTFTGATSGTWASTNETGLIVGIMSAAGTTKQAPSLNTWVSGNYTSHSSCTNWADSTSNYINITGVQLEVGDTATPFEHRPYDMELARCQRYYEVLYNQAANIGILSATLTGNVTSSWCTWFFKQNKRAIPTFALGSGTSWVNVTPSGIHIGYDNVGFTSGTNYFYSSGTSGTPSLTASAEL